MNNRIKGAAVSVFYMLTLGLAPVPTTRAQSFLTNGLVAYYPLNGSANDDSGNGNNGVAYRTTNSVDRFGMPNGSLVFNGTNAWILIGTTVRPSVISVSAWFATSAKTNLTGSGADVLLRDRFHGWHLQIDLPSGMIDAAVARSDGDQPPVTTASGYNDGIWHMATFTYDGYTTAVYADGILTQKETVSSQQGILFNPGYLAIGRDGDFPGSYFQGKIDDVRIYNRALSVSEVQQLYEYESQPPPCMTPRHATATVTVDNGFVVAAAIIDAGCGYTNSPAVEIIGGGGSGAAATAVITNGFVSSLTIRDAGSGYTSPPVVLINSPASTPWQEIGVSKVKVTEHFLVRGRTYVFESSTDLQNWSQVAPQFTAQDETISQEFDVDMAGRYFRIRQVP